MMSFGAPGEYHGSTPLLNTPSLEFCFGDDVPSLPEFKQLRTAFASFPQHTIMIKRFRSCSFAARFHAIMKSNFTNHPMVWVNSECLGQPRSGTCPITHLTKYQVACVCRPPGGSQPPYAVVWTIALWGLGRGCLWVGREFESGNRTLHKLKDIYHASLIPAFSEPTETLVVACTHQRLDERERLPLTGEQRCLHSAREGFLPNSSAFWSWT